MKTFPVALTTLGLTVLVLAAALSACSSTSDPAVPNGTTPAPSATAGPDHTGPGGGDPTGSAAQVAPRAPDATPPTGEEAEVEGVFRGYYQALLGRDYAAACAINAQETTATLIDTLTSQGLTVGTCEEAYSAVYAIPGAADTADRIAQGTTIENVTVDGDSATVSWSAQAQGQVRTVDSGFRRVDGQWRLLSAGL